MTTIRQEISDKLARRFPKLGFRRGIVLGRMLKKRYKKMAINMSDDQRRRLLIEDFEIRDPKLVERLVRFDDHSDMPDGWMSLGYRRATRGDHVYINSAIAKIVNESDFEFLIVEETP